MFMKKSLTILAGATALALSAGANATTTTSIIVNIIDETNGNSLVFDTSLPTSTTDPGAQSFNLATNAAYESLIAGETSSSDVLYYSVVGYTNANTVDTTSLATPTVVAGQKSSGAAVIISQFLASVANPSGGSTYLPASTTPAASQWLVDSDPGFTGDIGGSDTIAVGSSANFYAITTSNASGSRNGASVAQLASQWTLSTAGLLTYGSAGTGAVPLPAPVVLLLSGLGLMGVVARRRQAAAAL